MRPNLKVVRSTHHVVWSFLTLSMELVKHVLPCCFPLSWSWSIPHRSIPHVNCGLRRILPPMRNGVIRLQHCKVIHLPRYLDNYRWNCYSGKLYLADILCNSKCWKKVLWKVALFPSWQKIENASNQARNAILKNQKTNSS